MTYSCCDFTDDISSALDVELPDDSPDDNVSGLADLALAEIDRLQESGKAFVAALGAFTTMPDDTERAADAMTGMRISFAELRQVKAALAGVPVIPASVVFVAIFETRHGDETRTFHRLEDAQAWRRDIATENWAAHLDEDKPADPQETADAYFERVGESRGDFFRIEECKMEGPAAPSPGIDWRAIAQELAGALSSCSHQIGQMSGMFDDDDGTIAAAVDDADKAEERYRKAGAVDPVAPAPATRTIWTLTTDGDECPLTTSVHPTEQDAMESVRNVLEDDCKPDVLERLPTMTADELSEVWGEINEGACIIESHAVPA